MEQMPLTELRNVADIQPASMTRRERLERWAELLENEPRRRLKSLGEIELKARAERHSMREDGSPLAVAFDDPVLRAEGLPSDKLGDAIAFFEMSESDAHWLLCSCLNGQTMQACEAAARVRAIATPNTPSIIVGCTIATGGAVLAILLSLLP